MNYELCKKLKDAGFPQTFTNPTHYIEKDSDAKFGDVAATSPEKFISIPTLSELIEVCGKGFHGIYIADNWKAHGFKSDNEFGDIYTMGSTPEESVANLWLALNNE